MDTNVLLSGIFFGGLPRMVLGAWANSKFELLLTPAIFDEYLRTCERLATTRSGWRTNRYWPRSPDVAPSSQMSSSRSQSRRTPMMTSSCSVPESTRPS